MESAPREGLPDLPDQSIRDDLSRLIREAHAEVSYQEMAFRSERAGSPVSKPYLQKMATGATATAPTPDRLRGIAAATRRPYPVVQRAAAQQFLDYRATELSGYDDDVRVIVAHLAGMGPTDRRKWRRMIEAAEQVDAES